MCNLYRTRSATAEIANFFRADTPSLFNTPEEVYPGTPGLVIVEEAGRRELRSMTWGFPLILKAMRDNAAKRGVAPKPKPVNNVADLSKPMWKGIASKTQWRCLIPVTSFAEAEGPKGRMTRTWFSIKDQPVFAWAGFWRISAEWGPVYTGLMTDANEAIQSVHNRMPVLLHPEEAQEWLQAPIARVLEIQAREFPSDLIEIDRTSEFWVRRSQEVLGV